MTPVSHPLLEKKEITLSEIAKYPLILPPKDSLNNKRKQLEDLFKENNLSYCIVMESSNIELSSIYVEMGLGISFATIVKDLPAFKQRDFRFMSLSNYFKPEFLVAITRKHKILASHMISFIDMLLM